jgi:hypothetical protein
MKAKFAFAFSILTMAIVLVVSYMGTPTAAHAAESVSPKLVTAMDILGANTCTVNEEGDQVCYEEKDPQYTDPSYSCPTGSTPIQGDPTHCHVDTSGYVYTNRPTIPATYKCPEGFVEFDGGPKACRQVLVPGHYETEDQPSIVLCPDPVFWSYTYQGVTYSATIMYDKPESDPKHCHREAGNVLPVPIEDWPGFVRGRLNQENPENATGETVYSDCSTLGAGWETDPNVEHGCRKWIATTYNYADKIVDVPEHYGDCLTGYDPVPGSDIQCQKYEEGGHDIDAILVAGQAYCSAGDLVNGKCRVVIECSSSCPYPGLEHLAADDPACVAPPVDPPVDEDKWEGGLSCAELDALGVNLPPHCLGYGAKIWFETIILWFRNRSN